MKYKKYAGTFTEGWTFELCCSECGATVQPGHKFCPQCGRRLSPRKDGIPEKELIDILNASAATEMGGVSGKGAQGPEATAWTTSASSAARCPRCKTSPFDCEFYNKGICEGSPACPPQNPMCVYAPHTHATWERL